jgi:phosphatidylserine/phosphatidylglycerophosphate/cardiolipin synthase-like enzyme
LIVQYSVDEKTENWLAKINNAAEISKDLTDATLFSENDFYQQFIRDLLDAKEEVIINSPFITSERTSKFVPIFSHLIKKGVNIFVMTRPAKEQSGAMVDNSKRELAALEELGVYVLPIKGRTHEKIGIIDRKILYEGSLNILSQRDSHEVMYRIAGEEPVKQMMGFMKLDKNLGPIGNCALKHCEVCTDPGSWYWTAKSKFGLWTFCLVGSHSVGKPPKTETEKKEYKKAKTELRKVAEFNEQGNLICPVHKMELLPKKGPFGPFWGCPKYKECGYLIDSKKADAALAKKG